MAERLAERFPVDKIILFGSHARGDFDEESDVDLLVVADLELPPAERVPALRRSLAGFPVACDIIVKTRAEYDRWRPALNHIVSMAEEEGVVLYERRAA